MTAEDIKEWERNEITKEFFSFVSRLQDSADCKIHDLLKPRRVCSFQEQTLQASFYNASLSVLEEVADIPNQMKIAREENE